MDPRTKGKAEEKGFNPVRIITTGSDGFAGSNYCLKAAEAGHSVLGVDVQNWFMPDGCETARLDVQDGDACKMICESFNPAAIIHTARAPGNLWDIERNRWVASQTNVIGTNNLVRCAEDLGATFVFLSTDWIFDGNKAIGAEYKEDDDAGPLSHYGVTKWMAEQFVKDSRTERLILRPAHIYGVHGAIMNPHPRDSIGLLERTVWSGIWRAIQSKKTVRVPDIMYQTPVYVNHLAVYIG